MGRVSERSEETEGVVGDDSSKQSEECGSGVDHMGVEGEGTRD